MSLLNIMNNMKTPISNSNYFHSYYNTTSMKTGRFEGAIYVLLY